MNFNNLNDIFNKKFDVVEPINESYIYDKEGLKKSFEDFLRTKYETVNLKEFDLDGLSVYAEWVGDNESCSCFVDVRDFICDDEQLDDEELFSFIWDKATVDIEDILVEEYELNDSIPPHYYEMALKDYFNKKAEEYQIVVDKAIKELSSKEILPEEATGELYIGESGVDIEVGVDGFGADTKALEYIDMVRKGFVNCGITGGELIHAETRETPAEYSEIEVIINYVDIDAVVSVLVEDIINHPEEFC